MNKTSDKNLSEPDLITKRRGILNVIQAVLVGSRAIVILFYILMAIIGFEATGKDIMKCLIEIGVLYFFLHIIKNGQKRVAALPMLGGFIIFVYGVRGIELYNGDIISILINSYVAIVGVFQFISMAYILSSSKFEFYCQYVLYNNSIKDEN